MTLTAIDQKLQTPARGRWRLAVPVSGVVAVFVVHVLAFTDAARFQSRADLGHLTFGAPLGWLTQDQSALAPPGPGTTGFLSPWEHPVSVDLVPLLLNVGLLTAALLIGWFCLGAARHRLSRQGARSTA